MPANRKAQIERINQVSAMARTSWIALLGYLAFIGVTLLGVEDADFFVGQVIPFAGGWVTP